MGLYSAGDIKKAAQYASILAELRYRRDTQFSEKSARIYEPAIAAMMDRFDEVMQLDVDNEPADTKGAE